MQYLIPNGPMQTTAGFAKVTTANVIKTMLQGKFVIPCRVVEWGFSFDGSAAATPGMCELITTGTVFGTVTASANADITQYDGEAVQFGDPTTALITVGTAATGYTCTSEGSITAVRNLDPELIAPTNQYVKQFPLGYRPFVKALDALRVRCTFGTAINAVCYFILEF